MFKRFEDSVEATEFMEKIEAMLNDPRMIQWANATDSNFGTETRFKLARAAEIFQNFLDEMHEAC